MSGPAWTLKEILYFLDLNAKGIPAEGIACGLRNRSRSAVQGMRRKLKRLRELGAPTGEIPFLLEINETIVLTKDLRELQRRARLNFVAVRPYLRRGRVTGKPHLVDAHARAPVEEQEPTVWDLRQAYRRAREKRP